MKNNSSIKNKNYYATIARVDEEQKNKRKILEFMFVCCKKIKTKKIN